MFYDTRLLARLLARESESRFSQANILPYRIIFLRQRIRAREIRKTCIMLMRLMIM